MTVENSVMVFIEHDDGNIADVSKELICEAGKLAQKLDVCVTGVAMGNGMEQSLSSLGNFGCKTILYVDDPRLARFTSVPWAKTTAAVIQKYDPQIVLFGASATGRDVAPRVASQLKCGLTADCTNLQIGDYKFKGNTFENILLQIRPAFGGNVVATIVSPESRPSMATVREGVMQMHTPDTTLSADIVSEPCSLEDTDFLTEIIEVIKEEKGINLKSAQIIVSAGMGAGNPESIDLVKNLASTLGGVVGASRPVVDAGLLPRAHQVGQTGTTVRPNLYIACGISGQIQHRAGMDESRRIIAINKDPNAPVFDIADYGIVGDIQTIIPKMIKAYKTKV